MSRAAMRHNEGTALQVAAGNAAAHAYKGPRYGRIWNSGPATKPSLPSASRKDSVSILGAEACRVQKSTAQAARRSLK